MIPRETIDKIFGAARIEEVVGDFVTLKKRGVNMLGLCPFHNEKTPSFTVSPAKGIYKCFGCARGGNSVNFIMDHEQLTYPEALRYLAKKYNIEIEEEERTPEQLIQQSERESLLVVCSFAQKHFTENLHHTDEGRSVGLSYFKERGFNPAIIEKFQLGYSPDKWRGFTDAAIAAGHKMEYLVKAGLTIKSEKTDRVSPIALPAEALREGEAVAQDRRPKTEEDNQKEQRTSNNEQPTTADSGLTTYDLRLTTRYFDRFSARVIFPVHNVTGRVIAFGGRTLKTDKKVAKYINSPETAIYHKSNVLYGMFFAKKMIIAEDNCYLVEGYTDVISMHQAGIENVVASSGTSLTVEQIRQIRRYTPNITILYDGDSAGIKASFRGIDLILEEGMNVKVLLFPDGEDPDSFSRKVSQEELKSFIKQNANDFITFKTNLLYSEAKSDPIKRANLIKEIVESVSVMPEQIIRSVYIRECSRIMQMEEQVLLNELNKIRRKKFDDRRKKDVEETHLPKEIEAQINSPQQAIVDDCEYQEKDIIRLLLNYGGKDVTIDGEDEEGKPMDVTVNVAELIVHELKNDNIAFDNPVYHIIFHEIAAGIEKGVPLPENHFINHPVRNVAAAAVDLISFPHSLSENWEKHGIMVQTETMVLRKSVLNAVYALKEKKLEKMILENQRQLNEAKTYEDTITLVQQQQQMIEAKKMFANRLGRIILK